MKLNESLLPVLGLMLGLVPASIQAQVTLTTLASFNGTNGADPLVLIQDADGSFCGTTHFGGIGFDPVFLQGSGTIFKLTPDGVLSNLVMFDSDRAHPGCMFRAADQNYYGTSLSWDGSLFKLTPDGSLADFDPVTFGGTNGQTPVWLVEDRSGNFYGVTYWRNTGFGLGTVFKIDTNLIFSTLVVFDGTNGANPGRIILGVDGSFYGTTHMGGGANFGTVFKMTIEVKFRSFRKMTGAWLSFRRVASPRL